MRNARCSTGTTLTSTTFNFVHIIELLGPPQQLDEPQQPDGAAAVLAAAQANGYLAADSKRMEPNQQVAELVFTWARSMCMVGIIANETLRLDY